MQSDQHRKAVPRADEPQCLIRSESRWYQPGRGFTCQQIMLPMMAIMLASACGFVFAGWQILNYGWQGSMFALGAASVLILGLSVRSILFIRSALINPLTEVRHWVSKVRGGDMSARMPALEKGEFDELGGDINGLASLIETLTDNLDAEVDAQTENLARKTESLELLYEVVTSVNAAYEVNDLLAHFMHRLGEVHHADGVVVRILRDSQLELVESYGLSEKSDYLQTLVPMRFVLHHGMFGRGAIEVRTEQVANVIADSRESGQPVDVCQIVSIPLQYRDSILGCYQLFLSSRKKLPRDSPELLMSIGQHLGVAIEQARLDVDADRLLLVEQRAKMANELHDSLAQTLASLRFQVRVVDETLHQGEEQVTWEELEKLESKVEQANRELRALIGRFRAPLQDREVVISVEKLIRKFRQDTGTAVFFQNEWSDDNLSAEQRVDVIQIVKEALSNIKKHADAKTVRVLIRHQAGRFRVMVEDDGRGYDEKVLTYSRNDKSGEHIGRQIMVERAENLGAELKMESEPGDGSVVSLEFTLMERDSGLRTVGVQGQEAASQVAISGGR